MECSTCVCKDIAFDLDSHITEIGVGNKERVEGQLYYAFPGSGCPLLVFLRRDGRLSIYIGIELPAKPTDVTAQVCRDMRFRNGEVRGY